MEKHGYIFLQSMLSNEAINYVPCSNSNLDIFPKARLVANTIAKVHNL